MFGFATILQMIFLDADVGGLQCAGECGPGLHTGPHEFLDLRRDRFGIGT